MLQVLADHRQAGAAERARRVSKVSGNLAEVLCRPAAAVARVAARYGHVQQPVLDGRLDAVTSVVRLQVLQFDILVADERCRVARIDAMPVVHDHAERVEAVAAASVAPSPAIPSS